MTSNKNKKEKRTFWCTKHKTFHKFLYHGKPSKTYNKCLNSKNKDCFYQFKELIPNSILFKLQFKKNWKQEKADYYKSI